MSNNFYMIIGAAILLALAPLVHATFVQVDYPIGESTVYEFVPDNSPAHVCVVVERGGRYQTVAVDCIPRS